MTDTAIFQTSYDRSACDIGIVHVGYGAFHRAHQAVYLDDYMQATGDLRWGIAAVNLRASETEAFADAATAKDGYLLKSIAPDGTHGFRTVRAHRAFVDAARDLQATLDLVALNSVHAVSITVTESGYSFNPDWSLDLTAPAIASELVGGPVQSIYGFLAAALACRVKATNAPLSILCCDNIRNNGAVLRGALLTYLQASGQPELADWVRQNAAFPSSMVDRITPRSTDALRQEACQRFPQHAASPVHAEVFKQWVLQGTFAADMPDLAKVGVQIVEDVEPYEEAKIRILNGGHTGLCYLGALAGHQTFDQAMLDPALRRHFDRWERDEVLPGLDGLVPFDTTAYLAQIAQRFENAGIADQLERICMDGYSKMAIYIRPTLRTCLLRGITPQASYECVASWVVYARKALGGRIRIPYHEPFRDRLEPLLPLGQETALASDPNLWGDLPGQFDRFVPDLAAAIQQMEDRWQD